jgi:hypothetical protein
MMPNQFGLSAFGSGDTEKIEGEKYLRFKGIYAVDIVSNGAATNGLFLSQKTNETNNIMIKQCDTALGLPETATEE